MTVAATVVADSISPQGIRLTTMQLRYPKFIHGEFMTHRVFSRNASSSRAIPVERMIADIERDPAMPVWWGKNQAGMQAREELSDEIEWPAPDSPRSMAKWRWKNAMLAAIDNAWEMHKLGAHKQIVNRILEPWLHINVVCTSTEWSNFYALRRHPDAQPEMKALADAMWEAQQGWAPRLLSPGQWHLPYVDQEELDVLGGMTAVMPEHDYWLPFIKLSVARCARVSYLTHEGKTPSVEDDLKLYERLVGATPLHASPAEHQATPDEFIYAITGAHRDGFSRPYKHGNFVGWRQFRKMLPNENARDR